MQTLFCRQHRRQLFCLDNCSKSTPNYRELLFSESTFWLIFGEPNDIFLQLFLQGFSNDFCKHFIHSEAVRQQRQVYSPPSWVGWNEQRKQELGSPADHLLLLFFFQIIRYSSCHNQLVLEWL